MRISDWSSDVCSSDLADARARLADVLARDPGAKRRADDIYRMWDLLGTLPAPRKWTPSRTAAGIARLKFRPRSMFTPLVARAVAASLIFAIAALGALSLFHSPEIGRASCRERVCQYV